MSRGTSAIDRVLAVHRGDYWVATLRDVPGFVRSALRGVEPAVMDAVVSGEIRAIEEEQKLADLIQSAGSFDLLLDALEDAGYELKSMPASCLSA